MRKILFTLIGFLSICSFLSGKQIDVQSAQNVAKTFLGSSTQLRSSSPATEPSYHLVLAEGGIDIDGVTSAKPSDRDRAFAAYYTIQNTGDAYFGGYSSIGLIDNNGVLKYVLSETVNTSASIATDAPRTFWFSCYIPLDTAPGKYKVKVIYKKRDATNWTILNEGATPLSIDFTVIGEEGTPILSLDEIRTENDITWASIMSSFNTSVKIKNTGNATFRGDLLIILKKPESALPYGITEKIPVTIAPGQTLSETYECFVGRYVPMRDYQLRIAYSENGTSSYLHMTEGAMVQGINFTIGYTPRNRNAILSEEKVEVSVYPNPVSDVLNIKAGDATIKQVMLSDMLGKVVLRAVPAATSAQLSIQHLAKGTYILTVTTDKGITSHKISKQ